MERHARVVRPQEMGPARPGISWEVLGICMVVAGGWMLLVVYVGKQVGWW